MSEYERFRDAALERVRDARGHVSVYFREQLIREADVYATLALAAATLEASGDR